MTRPPKNLPNYHHNQPITLEQIGTPSRHHETESFSKEATASSQQSFRKAPTPTRLRSNTEASKPELHPATTTATQQELQLTTEKATQRATPSKRLQEGSRLKPRLEDTKSLKAGPRLPRQTPTTADGIPVFDRNKVSLDFPGSLFGPSVSLLIRTTKIVGDVIQV